MFLHRIDPVLLDLGPLHIKYYGLIYVIDFILIYLFLRYFVKRDKVGVSKEDVLDICTYALLGGIVGARVFYIIFYNLSYYISEPLKMLFLWEGGMSFHGGFLGTTLVLLYILPKKKLSFAKFGDMMVVPFALAMCLGRIGNFLNGELFGRVTNLPWGMNFGYEVDAGGDFVYRHPSQLYESAKNLFIFFVLLSIKLKDKIIAGKKLVDGSLVWLFVIFYSLLRFLVEFVRQPDEQLGFILGPLTMGQLLSLVFFVAGLVIFIYVNYFRNKKR